LLGELGPGAWLGEGALLTDAPRSASAAVTAPAQLYAITRPSFRYLVGRYPEMMANLRQIHEDRRLQTMRRALQVDLLGKVEFLADATPALLDDLARALTLRTIDGVVLREGDPAERFFMVGRGTVQVMHGQDVVAELSQGGYFGEAALLSGTRQSATVITAGCAVLYEVARDDFDRVLRNHPGVLHQIREVHLRRTNERVRRVLQERLVRQVPFLRNAEPAFLEALARDLRPQTVPDGHPVFAQDAEGDRMYFIARGGMRISRGSVTVAELGEGAYFGEMALLTAQRRTASATAIGTTELLELDRTGFEQLVGAHPGVHAQLEQVRQERASQLLALGELQRR
jgi:CRP-like cAMP-binding protein